MCYKAPGPRCSSHAQSILRHAEKAFSDLSAKSSDFDALTHAYTSLEDARRNYYMTPAGQTELRHEIERTGDPDGMFQSRLDYGVEMRRIALELARVSDRGDLDRDKTNGKGTRLPMNTQHDGVTVEDGLIYVDAERVKTDPQVSLNAFLTTATENAELAPETAKLTSENAKLWQTMTPEQKWGFWSTVTSFDNPSRVLENLHIGGWEGNFPALANVRDKPQSPQWHPEGAVHVHIQQAGDVAARNATRDGLSSEERQVAVLGAIAHDFGKATHTQVHESGHVSSVGHDRAGFPVAKNFLREINAPEKVYRVVPGLVAEHMCHAMPSVSRKALGRLIERLKRHDATPDQLVRIIDADTGGRGSASNATEGEQWRKRFKDYYANQGNPSAKSSGVNGHFLQKMGLTPGSQFSSIIKAYEKSGAKHETDDEREAWVRAYLSR